MPWMLDYAHWCQKTQALLGVILSFTLFFSDPSGLRWVALLQDIGLERMARVQPIRPGRIGDFKPYAERP